MALINCYECGKEISDRAFTCPHCGALGEAWAKRFEKLWRLARKIFWVTAIAWAAIIAAVLIFFFVVRPLLS